MFELYSALVDSDTDYTYDMYIAVQHEYVDYHGASEQRSALGIVDGLAAVDYDAEDKDLREKNFPMVVLRDHGLRVRCRDGEASVPDDKVRILGSIGAAVNQLDVTVHGRVAAAGLRRALEAGGEEADSFLAAVRDGHLCKVALDMKGSVADDMKNMQNLFEALCANEGGTAGTLVALTVTRSAGLMMLPEGCLQPFTNQPCKPKAN